MNHYLFVYGTLRHDSAHPMAQFLAEHSAFMGNARYQGQLYLVDYYPGLIASSQPMDEVQGELHSLYEPETVLARLDDYENCGQNYPPPPEYVRRQDWVKLENGKTVLAWLYFYNYPIAGLKRIQSGVFLR